MTTAEAIAILRRIQEPEAWEPQINESAFEALDMAISALETQNKNHCADCQEFDCCGCEFKSERREE